jgi:predicted membrane protein
MSFWDFEHRRRLKELKYIRKTQRAAYRMEKKRRRSFFRAQRNRCQCFYCKGKRMIWGLMLGVLLILWGLSHIAEIIFSIHIPIFGIVFGLFLVYLGIRLITGFSHWSKNNHQDCNFSCEWRATCMGTSHISIDQTTLNQQRTPFDYSTVMGKSIIDLKSLTAEAIRAKGAPLTMHIDTVMGSTTIILNKQVPTRVIAKGGCAKVSTPDDCIMACGSHIFNSHVNEEPVIIIYTSTVMGETEVIAED